jgi:ribose transport system permease protein
MNAVNAVRPPDPGQLEPPLAVWRRGIATVRDYGIVLAFLALFVTLTFASPAFFSSSNLLNILDQNAAVGIMACAGTFVFIAGGFDLSVAAVFALSGVVAAKVAVSMGVAPGLLAGVLAGLAVGVVNGVATTVGRVNAFVATLATSIMVRGLAVLISGGLLITVVDASFRTLGTGTIGDVKYTILVWLVFALLSGFVLSRTTIGRSVYACGGNPEAARLSGVRVSLVRASTFAFSGLAAGLAGIIEASRVATGQADSGAGLELAVIAAIVIGGTSIAGGEGAIWRTVLGVLLLALIGNGFNLLSINASYQQMFQGAIILGAVGLDAWARRRTV